MLTSYFPTGFGEVIPSRILRHRQGTIDLEFHIRHLPGGLFTDKLFGGLKPREKLQFEGPLGSFFLRDSPKPALFIASGTGYAPIRSMLLKYLPLNTGRKMILFWGGRTRKDLYHDGRGAAVGREVRKLPIRSGAF